tara:strand:- start:90 stop:410 length:321 start_codon:yes stop_codon:yes gene_type:complete
MYTINDIEITIPSGKLFMCSGELDFEYEPGEPDEPWGHWGATPGYASQATSIEVTELECDYEDDAGKLHQPTKEERKAIEEAIVQYYEDNNELITESYEESAYDHI